jgi:hypothetical protein
MLLNYIVGMPTILYWFSSKLCGSRMHHMLLKGLSGMAEATIEGLAFPICPSREPSFAGRRGCLSEASSGAAEKDSEGTALKT